MKGRYAKPWGNRRRSLKAQNRYGADLERLSDAELRRRASEQVAALRGRASKAEARKP